MRGSSRAGQSGRGLVGFLVALVLVVYGGLALKELFAHKHRLREMTDFTEEVLVQATQARKDATWIREQMVAKANELGIPANRWDANNPTIEVKGDRWYVRFSWTDEFSVPGYTTEREYEIERTWTRFTR